MQKVFVDADDSRNGAGMRLRFGFCPSRFGLAVAVFSDRGLCGLGFGEGKTALLADMKARWPKATFVRDDTPALPEIFAGKSDVPLHLIGTPWQVRVWRTLLDIPAGRTVSYGALAKKLSSSPRAVGRAVGKNPVAWFVPCHRVIGAGGKLTGYHWGLERKRAMLAAEGCNRFDTELR